MDIKKLYQNPKFPASFAGKQRFYNAVKSTHADAKFKSIEHELKKLIAILYINLL